VSFSPPITAKGENLMEELPEGVCKKPQTQSTEVVNVDTLSKEWLDEKTTDSIDKIEVKLEAVLKVGKRISFEIHFSKRKF
jgi:hypothetical protein